MIEFKNIVRAFLLPLADEINYTFILGLDKPIKQGNTIYPYLVMQFKTDFEETIILNSIPSKFSNIS